MTVTKIAIHQIICGIEQVSFFCRRYRIWPQASPHPRRFAGLSFVIRRNLANPDHCYRYRRILPPFETERIGKGQGSRAPNVWQALLRGWWNTVEIVQFEISNSMKPYPSVSHAYISKLRLAICFCLKQNNIDEVSNRVPPTSHL